MRESIVIDSQHWLYFDILEFLPLVSTCPEISLECCYHLYLQSPGSPPVVKVDNVSAKHPRDTYYALLIKLCHPSSNIGYDDLMTPSRHRLDRSKE